MLEGTRLEGQWVSGAFKLKHSYAELQSCGEARTATAHMSASFWSYTVSRRLTVPLARLLFLMPVQLLEMCFKVLVPMFKFAPNLVGIVGGTNVKYWQF